MQPRFFLILVAVMGTIIIVLLLVKKVQSDKQDLLAATPVPTIDARADGNTPKPPLPDDIAITRADSANPSQFGFSSAVSVKVNGKDVSSFTRSEDRSAFRATWNTARCRASQHSAGTATATPLPTVR